MIVLGIDTATSATAVALRLGDGAATEARDDPPTGAHPGHATRLLELARELLDGAGLGWSALERIAVGVGPGTFTGLRVGIATARGLSQSLAVELSSVPSPRALAHGALLEAGAAGVPPGAPVIAAIDARRGEVFAAVYDAGQEELVAPRPLAPEGLGQLLAQIEPADEVEPAPVAVGDGAVRYRAVFESAGISVPPDASPLHRLRATAICALALEQSPPGDLQAVLPDYRRRPDAELAIEAAGAGKGGGT
ncbi:MAG: tRNA (adenosine(37)-N6)-threonylcarbamoyltransferase complex dimerization subunit type 1 TsaB [Solirubrobacteraceae bacterium]